MARLLRMPGVAANATEAVLADWTVEEGAAFGAEDPVATVETEKAVVDIEAGGAGALLRRLVAPGTKVDVGAPIALIGDPGEQVADVDALLAELGAVSAHAAASAADPEGGTADTGPATLPEPAAAERVVASGAATRATPAPAAAVAPTSPNGQHRGRIFASPLARRLAKEAGLEMEEIRGSGPRGRIIRRDVEAAVAARAAVKPQLVATPAPSRPSSYTEVEHSRMRRAIAARLTESKQTVPHFYVRGTIDARRLLRLRAELNEGAEAKVSVNDLVVKAVARAHVLVPEMNVTWDADAVRQYSGVDVSVAVATDRGLLTPVLRGVEALSLTAVSLATRELADRARAGGLRQEELEGGSISVTNLGMFGTEEFAAIINPPQAAILAVGAVREEPVVRKGGLKAGKVMRVTLSVDHRPVDGVVAARWMQAFTDLMEHPLRILA